MMASERTPTIMGYHPPMGVGAASSSVDAPWSMVAAAWSDAWENDCHGGRYSLARTAQGRNPRVRGRLIERDRLTATRLLGMASLAPPRCSQSQLEPSPPTLVAGLRNIDTWTAAGATGRPRPPRNRDWTNYSKSNSESGENSSGAAACWCTSGHQVGVSGRGS